MASIRSETRSLKAAEYRSRAQDAVAAAESCGLVSVRLNHERAAAVWTSLAEAAERRDPPRTVQQADVEAVAHAEAL